MFLIPMDITLDLVNGVMFLLLSAWVLMENIRQRRGGGGGGRFSNHETTGRKSIVFSVLFNAILSFSYVGLFLYEMCSLKTPPLKSTLQAVSSTTVTLYALLAMNKVLRDGRGWPLALVLWWVFTCILNTIWVSVFLITKVKTSKKIIECVTIAEVVHFIATPFSVLICVNALWLSYTKKHDNELETPLLHEGQERYPEKDDGYFAGAGIWSHLTFQWLNPLFSTGRNQKLESTEVPPVPPSDRAEEASLSLEESLRTQKTDSLSLIKAIGHAVWRPLAINSVFAGVNTVASYMGPLLINDFVNFIMKDHDHDKLSYTNNFGLVLAVIFFFTKTIESLTQRQWFFGANRIGVRARAGVIVLIYKKSLSMKQSGLSTGTITNLINVDVERIGDFFSYIHQMWLLPLQVFLGIVILYKNLGGIPSATALLSIIFIMVGNTPLANMQKKLHSNIMESRDTRIKVTSECLKNMRVLKLHSWESPFFSKLLQLREKERAWQSCYLYTCSAVAFLFWASPTLVSVTTFGACILLKTPLAAGTVLSAIATLRILQEPIYNLPEQISTIAQLKVSIDRIQEFIRQEEQTIFLTSEAFGEKSDIVLEIEKGEYAWETNDSNSRKPTVRLTDRIEIFKGQKVAICGSVGSGKSSFLCSLMGEIPRISGRQIKVYGSRAYVPQRSWIQTGTIRDNVLFGKQLDKTFYGDVLEGCALYQDLEAMTDGDLSVVGERGLNLSGGQKQRVQLARAVYSDSDVYFLDDPFSAVDAHTGKHLFKTCLNQLLSQKTVLYVTHQLEFLDASDLVLVMEDGRIVEFGKYEELMSNPYGKLVRQMAAHRKLLNEVEQAKTEDSLTTGSHVKSSIELPEKKSEGSISKQFPGRRHEEESEAGRVKWQVYSTFVTSAYRGALVPVILICQVLFQALQMGSNYWLAWAAKEHGKGMPSKKQLIGVFTLLSGGSTFFILGRAVLLSTIAIETSRRLYLNMINSVFRAPISFFDNTPSSRILSRSSTDQSTIDTDIPYRLAGLAFALIQLFSIIFLMCQVAWQAFPVFVAIVAISIWYQAYYIRTARELARMVGIQKAPIAHHFSESTSGVVTIRCFKQEERFAVKILGLVDNYSSIVFHNTATMEWLCVRINFLFNLVFFIVLVILVNLPMSAINPSLAGLAATYGLNMNVLQGWVIWNLCNVENKMISVERVLQFTNLQSEAPLVIEDCRPQPEWPTNGRIELENLQVQYGPSLPVVLKRITCTFPGGKKVGIVGRTGSGKSTLIQSLFRLVEPVEGRILIDGVDIGKMGLQDLRSRLSIIPQDPTLFQGNIRMNVDPLQQHSDHEIWEVLTKCRLRDKVKQDSRLLDAPVAEDGENWSVGQRQLVCLSRALLQKRRIWVLDEATASMDTVTDNVIQKTIREETSSCTVLIVAHRIPIVVDSDRVLVLDNGSMVEYDSPSKLLNDTSSSFSKLVVEFVRTSSERL